MKKIISLFKKHTFFVISSFLLFVGVLSCSLPSWGVNRVDRLCDGENLVIINSLKAIWTQGFEYGVGTLPVVSKEVIVAVDTWADNKNFPATIRNKLVGSDLETGKILWTYSDEWESWISLLSVTEENIALQHINDQENKVVLLSISDGVIFQEFPGVFLDLLVTPHHLFFRPGNRATVARSLETGQEVFNLAPKTIDASKQFFYKEGLVYSVYGNELNIFRDQPFEWISSFSLLRWNLRDDYNFSGQFFVFDQHLIAIFPDGLGLYQVGETGGGTELWNIKTEQFGRARLALWPPPIIDNRAYLFNENGMLTEIDLQQGQVIRQISVVGNIKPVSTPVFYHEKLYAVFADGTLRSFTFPELTETVEIQSNVIRFYDNEKGAFHAPGVAVAADKLLVSFGCKNLYAFQTP